MPSWTVNTLPTQRVHKRSFKILCGGEQRSTDIFGAAFNSDQGKRDEEGGGNLSTDPAVTIVLLSTGRTVHLVTWQHDRWVTSAEISSLVPHWQGWDLLYSMLARKKVSHKVREVDTLFVIICASISISYKCKE